MTQFGLRPDPEGIQGYGLTRWQDPHGGAPQMASAPRVQVKYLLKKYWLLALAGILAGALLGLVSVVVQPPVYLASTMLEIQSVGMFKNSFGEGSGESENVNIATQIRLLQSGPFLPNVISRLMTETVPPVLPSSGLISRLRSRVRPAAQDPVALLNEAVTHATSTFHVRQINGTRLIEIDCESTHPEVAANFVNTLASEYVQQSNQTRSQSQQRAASWLTSMLEEARIRYQEAETKLNDFNAKSGAQYAGSSAPLSETKLQQLKLELANVQAERITKQTRWETIRNTPPEALPALVGGEGLREGRSRLMELKSQLASLQLTLTPQHYKVKRAIAEIETLEKAVAGDVAAIVKGIQNDYEEAVRKERHLMAAYQGQNSQIIANAGNATSYDALKQEVETARTVHNSLLLQVNQAANASSAPVSNVRVVSQSQAPPLPYKPRAILNISMGCLLGAVAMGGFAFLRENRNRSVRNPGEARQFVSIPELGVIPHTEPPKPRWRAALPPPTPDGEPFAAFGAAPERKELAAWQKNSLSAIESFRTAIASLLRGDVRQGRAKSVVVTSALPGDGKTTLVANLGIALAESGRKVVLVDADFRRPRLAGIFDLEASAGQSLTEILSGEGPLGDAPGDTLAQPTRMQGLWVVPNQGGAGNIQRLLHSPRLPELLARLEHTFDLVLIDVPPVLSFADARLTARHTDGVIFVVRAGVTSQDDLMGSIEQLVHDGIDLFGTILNDWTPPSAKSGHYYAYHYAASEDK